MEDSDENNLKLWFEFKFFIFREEVKFDHQSNETQFQGNAFLFFQTYNLILLKVSVSYIHNERWDSK